MSDFRIDKITNRTGDTGPQIAGISTFSGTSGIQLPVGPTEYRGGRGRGVWAGGYGGGAPTYPELKTMDMIEIATIGDAVDFGDLTQGRYCGNMGSSSTRGLFAGGGYPGAPSPGRSQVIDYVTVSSSGGASDFGSLTRATIKGAGFSDGIRGVFAGGYDGASPYGMFPHIQFVNIASTGDSSDFGSLSGEYKRASMSTASPTRGVITGMDEGNNPSTVVIKDIQYVTTATKGDAQEFGELTIAKDNANGVTSNGVRGIFFSGAPGPGAAKNTIDYITIATKGNAINFGDQISTHNYGAAANASNKTRGVVNSTVNNSVDLEYITISTTGNGTDFGDLTEGRKTQAAIGDANGGIG